VSGPPEMSPREARDRYLNHRRTDATESSVQSWYYRLKRFVEWAEEERIESMDDVTGWVLDEYETHRRGQSLSASTLNGEMQTLKNWLEYLARIEVVDEELPEKVHVPEIPDGEESNDEMLEHGVAFALINTYRDSPGRYGSTNHALLELLWFTGARVGSIKSLDLRDYNSEDRYVLFKHRPGSGTALKNGKDGQRAVGLPETVTDVLDRYIAENRTDTHDDAGRQPLFTTTQGRPAENTFRVWTYLATQPCLYRDCPHGKKRDTCDYVHVHHASKCPSSMSPHRIRTGSITWQRDCGLPAEIVAQRVNATLEVIEKYYDKASELQRLENRRRAYVSNLELDSKQ
jgi:site-specific recombinase XerD